MTALELTQIGNSVGVILPKDAPARLQLKKDDPLLVTVAASRVMLTPYEPTFDQPLEIGRQFMREHRETFHQPAM
jgi:putative addiction module antidote